MTASAVSRVSDQKTAAGASQLQQQFSDENTDEDRTLCRKC